MAAHFGLPPGDALDALASHSLPALVGIGVVMALLGLALAASLGTGGVSPWTAALPIATAAGLCLLAGSWPVRRAARVLWERGL